MDALSIISLAQAKSYLVWDGTSRDDEITRLIKSAVSLVERYTCYRLYEREEVFTTYGYYTDLPYYPIAIDSVKNEDNETIDYKERIAPLAIVIGCQPQATITATVGYAEADVDNIPQPLVQACYKLITYYFENKDAYTVELPLDVQLLLNPFRRSATI